VNETEEILANSNRVLKAFSNRKLFRAQKALMDKILQGHGSGLNADLLDGHHATEVIEKAVRESAKIPVRVPSGGGGLATHGNEFHEPDYEQFGVSLLLNGARAMTAGITYDPSSDTDMDLATVNVTGTPKLWWDESEDSFEMNKALSITGIGDGGLTSYDLKVGDTVTPDYGMIQFGNAVLGRTSYNVGNIDLDGAILLRNISGPVTSEIEFCFSESTGNTARFVIPKAGVGNATYNPRSFLIAGPAPANTDMVKVGYWQTNNNIFDNLACDTAGDGADLGVQNDLEVEGDIFGDSIKESTTGANITFGDDIALADGEFVIFDKASGNGIKVDTATPTFGWRDILGDVFARNTGGTRPSFTTYRDTVLDYQFGVGDEEYLKFHIPHDYVEGTDLHFHLHWSHIGTLVTGGTVTFEYEITYAKGHNQAPFPATVTGTIAGTASTTQYQHIISEGQISASAPSGSQIDSDDLEPDGVIICRVELQANNITVSGGAVPNPFIHYADIHYQSTNIGTKEKAPNFYI
jgi:hypothetical protein